MQAGRLRHPIEIFRVKTDVKNSLGEAEEKLVKLLDLWSNYKHPTTVGGQTDSDIGSPEDTRIFFDCRYDERVQVEDLIRFRKQYYRIYAVTHAGDWRMQLKAIRSNNDMIGVQRV